MPALEIAGRSPSFTVSAARAGALPRGRRASTRARMVAARRRTWIIGPSSGERWWERAKSSTRRRDHRPSPGPPPGGERERGRSDGPGLAAPAHVPEHPLVAAGGHEVAPHRVSLFLAEPGREGVGAGEHRAHHRAELLGGVRADPARVEGIARAGALEGLAHLPVDPVAGQ